MNKHQHNHSGKNLRTAFFINLAFTIFELIGGFYVNSIAIISDAFHDLGDSISLGSAWYLDKKSKSKPDNKFSFGYSRFSLLGALINSVVLIGGSIYVISEAIGRILKPEHSDAGGMIIFAIIGVAVNGYAAWKMSGGNTLNEKVVSWHLLEDVLGWAAVLVVAIIMNFYDTQYLDPILSLVITLYILWGVFGRLKETMFVFLQGVPPNIDIVKIKEELLNIRNVESIHHTHVWSLEGEQNVFSTHLKLGNIDTFDQILEVKSKAKELLDKYKFSHYTIETELDRENCRLLDK